MIKCMIIKFLYFINSTQRYPKLIDFSNKWSPTAFLVLPSNSNKQASPEHKIDYNFDIKYAI